MKKITLFLTGLAVTFSAMQAMAGTAWIKAPRGNYDAAVTKGHICDLVANHATILTREIKDTNSALKQDCVMNGSLFLRKQSVASAAEFYLEYARVSYYGAYAWDNELGFIPLITKMVSAR